MEALLITDRRLVASRTCFRQRSAVVLKTPAGVADHVYRRVSLGVRRVGELRSRNLETIRRKSSKPLRRRKRARTFLYLVRADGIEPTRPAWKAGVLPLNYARVVAQRGDSLLRRFGQACNIDLRMSPTRCVMSFSPGFYPVSHCESSVCAVLWEPWHSSLRRQPPRFILPGRRPRKRPPT